MEEMESKTLLLLSLAMFAVWFAWTRELRNFTHPCDLAHPRGRDSTETLLDKLRVCTNYPKNIVYWRRCLLCSVAVVVLLCISLPNSEGFTRAQILSMFAVVFVGTFAVASLGAATPSIHYANRCCELLKKRLMRE